MQSLLSPQGQGTRPLGSLDRSVFSECFNRRPFKIAHHLVGHPLFALPRLVELARSLPEDRVEYNAGDLPISIDPTQTPRTGLSVEETIQRIEECRSWLVLKNIESDPDYAQLLDGCLDQIAEVTEEIDPGMKTREGFIFVSSPGSVTPYHVDPEHNFLLQIRGQKEVTMFPPDDRDLLTEEELEGFYAAGGVRNLNYHEELADRAWHFDLLPGEGLHFPITAPHWVKNGPEVSISFSITFRTLASDRREILYRINRQLRRLGLRPTPVGTSPWRDRLKFSGFRTLRAVKKLLRPEREGHAGRYGS